MCSECMKMLKIIYSGVFRVAGHEYNHKNVPGCTREALRHLQRNIAQTSFEGVQNCVSGVLRVADYE